MPTENMSPRIGIVGAGAIGCYFGARLAHAGNTVSVLARGPALEALKQRGIRFEAETELFDAQVVASDDVHELGVQDIVIICVKAPALPEVAARISPLCGPDTIILPAQNGLPWWFFRNEPTMRDQPLLTVDPKGAIQANLPLDNTLGIVTIMGASCLAPGHVVAKGNRVVVGEPFGASSPRVERIANLFTEAGFAAQSSNDIRLDIWSKLLANAAYNPVSFLTHSSNGPMFDDPRIRELLIEVMSELIAVGRALGIDGNFDPDARIEASIKSVGNSKTSMLQDLEARRNIEVDCIVGAPLEAAKAVDVPTPTLGMIYALTRRKAASLGIYPEIGI